MSTLAHKTRPGFRIKLWSTTTHLCGSGFLPGQHRGRVWAMPCTRTVLDKQSGWSQPISDGEESLEEWKPWLVLLYKVFLTSGSGQADWIAAILSRTNIWECEWHQWEDRCWLVRSLHAKLSLCIQSFFWRWVSCCHNISQQQCNVPSSLLWLAYPAPLYIPGTKLLVLKLQIDFLSQHSYKKHLILHCQFSNISLYSS